MLEGGVTNEGVDYLLAKDKMYPMLYGQVQNYTKLTRKA
jgi:hypothetical protein